MLYSEYILHSDFEFSMSYPGYPKFKGDYLIHKSGTFNNSGEQFSESICSILIKDSEVEGEHIIIDHE